MASRKVFVMAAVAVYLTLACLPLLIAFDSTEGLALTRRPGWDDVASGIAMVGFVVILMEFVLLGRFRVFSTSLGSDFLMQSHQLMARTALAFLLAHPFLYSLWGHAHKLPDASYSQALKIDGLNLLTGGAAWLLMLGLVFSATKREGFNYDRWRRWHALMAVALIALAAHHVFSAGRYTAFTPLSLYWWLLIIIAALAIAVVYLIRPLRQKQHPFSVTRVEPLAKDIYALVISPSHGKALDFKPGQFAWLKLESTAATHDHPFSIASSPKASGELRFVIKKAGDFTASLARVSAGSAIYVDGPHGHFRTPDNASAVIMIAGGIGIAPFCGLLQSLAGQKDRRPVRLIYANRLAAQQVDMNQLADTAKLSDFKLIPVVGEPQPGDQAIAGQLDAPVLAQILAQPDISDIRDTAIFMICGPAAMIDSVERSLLDLGIPLDRIISEKFQYDFNIKAPRSRRTLLAWTLVSALLLAATLSSVLR